MATVASLGYNDSERLRTIEHPAASYPPVCSGTTGYRRRVPAEVAALRPGERALHHSLYLGFSATDARDDLAVVTGGRHFQFCRFIAGRS
jgi:hypothetical protein